MKVVQNKVVEICNKIAPKKIVNYIQMLKKMCWKPAKNNVHV